MPPLFSARVINCSLAVTWHKYKYQVVNRRFWPTYEWLTIHYVVMGTLHSSGAHILTSDSELFSFTDTPQLHTTYIGMFA